MALPRALIIEPNHSLEHPYAYLSPTLESERCASVEKGLSLLAQMDPDILFLSASFSLSRSLKVLESLKQKSTRALIPLVIVVDTSHRISSVPGTTWGNKLGLLLSISSPSEVQSTLNRILNT